MLTRGLVRNAKSAILQSIRICVQPCMRSAAEEGLPVGRRSGKGARSPRREPTYLWYFSKGRVFFGLGKTLASWKTMPCAEREKIIELLLAVVTAYSDAVQATNGLHGKALKQSLVLVESAQATYEDCRQVLIAHERSHGCGIKSAETSRVPLGLLRHDAGGLRIAVHLAGLSAWNSPVVRQRRANSNIVSYSGRAVCPRYSAILRALQSVRTSMFQMAPYMHDPLRQRSPAKFWQEKTRRKSHDKF
jgi:hypothetical protein